MFRSCSPRAPGNDHSAFRPDGRVSFPGQAADRRSQRAYPSFKKRKMMMTQVDMDKLNSFVGKMLGDLGGAFSVPTARIGYRLGLFDALHRHGAARISELAGRTGLAERY